MKEVHIDMTFKGTETIEVPDDWEWDGDLSSLLRFTDLSSNTAELVDWEVRL